MAHFAELNSDNIVLRVIVVDNERLLNENGVEEESIGIQYCKSLFGENTIWLQTSYNGNFRKRYAGIGCYYDQSRDAFIYPKLYQSWIFDEVDCMWKAPVEYPNDGSDYFWDEELLTWQKYNNL
jgi:hypothetical protein